MGTIYKKIQTNICTKIFLILLWAIEDEKYDKFVKKQYAYNKSSKNRMKIYSISSPFAQEFSRFTSG